MSNGRCCTERVCQEMAPSSAYQVHCDKVISIQHDLVSVYHDDSLIPHFFKSWKTLSRQQSLASWAGRFWGSQSNNNFFGCLASNIQATCLNYLNLICVSKSPILPTMPKRLGQLSSSKVLLPLNCSTYTQNTANTASMKSVQLTDQLLGKPRFQHHTATLPALQINVPASLVSIPKSKDRITETIKSPTCLCNLMANLTNYSTTCLYQQSQVLKLFNYFHHTSCQF